MRTLRSVLAFPVGAVSVLAGIVGIGIYKAAYGLKSLHKIWTEHVYIVIVWACRWVKGGATWGLKDLTMLNIQPRTKAQIAYADTLPGLQRYECQCGNPKCKAKGKIQFGPKMPAAMTFSSDAPIGELPLEIREMARNMERLTKLSPNEITRMLDAHEAIVKAAAATTPPSASA